MSSVPVDGNNGPADVCVIELGGPVGDIESMPYLEALRQLSFSVGNYNRVEALKRGGNQHARDYRMAYMTDEISCHRHFLQRGYPKYNKTVTWEDAEKVKSVAKRSSPDERQNDMVVATEATS